MSALARTPPRRTRLWAAAFAAVPLLGLAYQLCAERTAQALLGLPLGAAWFARAAAEPWARGLVGLEILSFAAWMYVLSKAELSAAFPLTAVSYLLVIALGWFGFHETATLAQVLGAAAILAGVWLLRPEPEAGS
jgi:multidrug transporter EmrE-like cation transporter